MSDRHPSELARPRCLATLTLIIFLSTCSSPAVIPPDAAFECGPATCSDGCCDGNSCVTASMSKCGSAGEVCGTCSTQLADSCIGGECICAAAGYLCSAGWVCTASGCNFCDRDCAGKCAGADDGCEGTCPDDDCDSGCCNEEHACVAPSAQTDLICGDAGQECRNCAHTGASCHDSLHICTSARAMDAEFIATNMVPTMAPSATFAVSVTMRNTGTSTWTAAAGYKLGAVNPQDNSTWGTGRVELDPGDSIAPGASKTFTFTASAPAAAGVANFQWRMLQEGLEWFGDYSEYRPVVITSGGGITVCEAARSLADSDSDAAPTIQGCVDGAAAGSVVELPAGVYRIDSKLDITAAAITLRSEGKTMAMSPCATTDHDCAELSASTSFADTGGILQLYAAGSVVDHLVVNGNKSARATSSSGVQCAAGSNSHGYNMRLVCNNCTVANSVSKNTLCGTGLEVSGVGSGAIVWRNTIADNGVHNAQGMWADGVTVHDYANSTFVANTFVDNTDVDFIFGGCQGCIIQDNHIRHSDSFAGSSFAALMLHAWPDGATSGNFTGSDTSANTIDCGSARRCGFGLYLGPDAWYDADTYGGTVRHNLITGAEQGLLIDDAHDMQVYNNFVANWGSSTDASCGLRPTSAYGIGNTSANIDTSRDTMDISYIDANWDGCIPNWWN